MYKGELFSSFGIRECSSPSLCDSRAEQQGKVPWILHTLISVFPKTSPKKYTFILPAHSNIPLPLLSVTSMTILSFGPGPLRLEKEPSASSGPGTGVPPLALELGELERLSRVGVAQGVRLGLRSRVRTVRVTTPFLSCWREEPMISQRLPVKPCILNL